MGGKDSSTAPEAPVDFVTNTLVGSDMGGNVKTFDDESKKKEDTINKKKMGTRGLQIPLAAEASTTTEASPSETGVQI